MKKVILVFPSYDSMWLFTRQAKAVNVRIEPRKYLVSGLFNCEEIEMALEKFCAVDQTENLANARLKTPQHDSVEQISNYRKDSVKYRVHLKQTFKFLFSNLHL